jgi:hypothetical protein
VLYVGHHLMTADIFNWWLRWGRAGRPVRS